MGMKYCPNCKEVVLTKALGSYSQVDFNGVPVKRRKIAHLEEDGGCGIVIWHGLCQIQVQHFPCTAAQFCEQLTIKHEIDPQSFWNAENPLPMRHAFQYFFAQPFAEFHHPLLMTGWTKNDCWSGISICVR